MKKKNTISMGIKEELETVQHILNYGFNPSKFGSYGYNYSFLKIHPNFILRIDKSKLTKYTIMDCIDTNEECYYYIPSDLIDKDIVEKLYP